MIEQTTLPMVGLDLVLNTTVIKAWEWEVVVADFPGAYHSVSMEGKNAMIMDLHGKLAKLMKVAIRCCT